MEKHEVSKIFKRLDELIAWKFHTGILPESVTLRPDQYKAAVADMNGRTEYRGVKLRPSNANQQTEE